MGHKVREPFGHDFRRADEKRTTLHVVGSEHYSLFWQLLAAMVRATSCSS